MAILLTVEYSTVEPLTVHWGSFQDYWQLWDSYVAAVDSGKRWTACVFAQTTCTWICTSIRIWRVLALILVQCREIVLYYGCQQLNCTISEGRNLWTTSVYSLEIHKMLKRDHINLEIGLANLPSKQCLSNDQKKQMKLIPHGTSWNGNQLHGVNHSNCNVPNLE